MVPSLYGSVNFAEIRAEGHFVLGDVSMPNPESLDERSHRRHDHGHVLLSAVHLYSTSSPSFGLQEPTSAT